MVPFADSAALTDQMFQDFRGHAPATADITRWVGPIGACTRTADELVVDLLPTNMGATDAKLVRLYLAYFQRPPDASGFGHWERELEAGKGLIAAANYFSRSPEFVRTYGSLSNNAFVKRVYANVLGRPGDTAGVAYWTKQLDAKKLTRGQVMVAFSESSENVAKRIDAVQVFRMYRSMMRKFPTKAAFFALLDPIAAGSSDLYQAAFTIRHSAPYAARFGG